MKYLNFSLVLTFFFLILQSKSFAQVTITYSYDNLNRLTIVNYSDGKQIFYSYDKLGNRLSQIITVPCQNPDIVITKIAITKYTSDKIYYRLQIKNQGMSTANLSSFALAAFNAPNPNRDGNAEYKDAIAIGGSIAPNDTINVNFFSNFNFSNNKYYLILTADYTNTVTECVETNNDLAKVVNPCNTNGNNNIIGNQTNKLIFSNNEVSIQNATLTDVTIFAPKTIQLPNTTLIRSTIALGGCLNITNSSLSESKLNSVKDSSNSVQSLISNMRLSEDSKLTFDLSTPQKLSLQIFGDSEKALVSTNFQNKSFESLNNEVAIDTSKWVKSQKYILHLQTGTFTEALVVSW